MSCLRGIRDERFFHSLDGLDSDDFYCFSEEELKHKEAEREEIKINCPGLSSLQFEAILNIIVKDIIGWENPHGGLFGIAEAFFYSVEEQARGALHVHMLLWLKQLPYNSHALQNVKNQKNIC